MSGGGSQTTASTPWGPASPYLLDIMQQAQKQYSASANQYSDPAANFGYNQTTGAVGGAIGGTTPFGSMASAISPNTTTAIQKQLSGQPDYTAVKGALDAANQQTWDSFNNQELPILNQNASFLGNPSGSIKDLNWATSQIGKNMDLNAQQQYLGEYDKAQANQLAAAGLGANIAQGAGAQSLQGANLYAGLAQMPQANLADYAGIVSGTGGKFGTDTATNKPGAGQTAANVIGGLTAGAGLVNSLFGTGGAGGGGAVGAIGNLFGGGGSAAGGSAAGGAAAAGSAGSILAGGSPALSAVGTSAVAPAVEAAGADAAAALGGSAAGGTAAGGAAAGGAGAAGGGTAGAAEAAPLLGPAAGGAAAIALPLAIAAYGYSKPAVELGKAYWSGVSNALDQPKDSQAYKAAALELAAGMSSPGTSNQIPAEIYAKAAQLGITPLGQNIDPNAVMGWRGYGQYAGNVRPA